MRNKPLLMTGKAIRARARMQEYRSGDVEKYRAYQREYRRKNKDKINAAKKENRIKNLERYKELERKSKAKHKEKRNAARRERNKASNGLLNRKHQLKTLYGLTIEEYVEMSSKQKGMCAINGCGRPANNVDHDHETKKVRSLLCNKCNSALGLPGECKIRISGLIEYMLQHKCVRLPNSDTSANRRQPAYALPRAEAG